MTGAFLEKSSGGAQAALRDHTCYISRMRISRTHCAVNLEYYHQVEFQSFSLHILSKHTAVKTPRALLMARMLSILVHGPAVLQNAFTNAKI